MKEIKNLQNILKNGVYIWFRNTVQMDLRIELYSTFSRSTWWEPHTPAEIINLRDLRDSLKLILKDSPI